MENTALNLIKTLKKAGYIAFFAGGCVRDMLLGHTPKDFDLVTNALPDQIEQIFEHTVPIGKQFGIIMVIENQHHFEIATFRSESGYSDGRRPDVVTFSNAEEDAKRRDFTINGLFYDPIAKKIIDYVGGQADLQAKLIRFIGDPHHRILEDHLRLLRAVRFKNQFDFQYEPATYQALRQHAPLVIEKVSPERIRDELSKMLLHSSKPSRAFEELSNLGILDKILPELENLHGCAQPFQYHQEGDVWTHTMASLDALPLNTPLIAKLATLFHDLGKPATFKLAERIRFDSHSSLGTKLAQTIMKRLQFSSKQIAAVSWCIEHHMMMTAFLEMNPGRLMHWFHHPHIKNLLATMKADAEGTTPIDLSLYNQIEELYQVNIKRFKEPPKPFLDGKDIMLLTGLKTGPQVGKIKQQLLEKQLDGEIKNLEEAKAWLLRVSP